MAVSCEDIAHCFHKVTLSLIIISAVESVQSLIKSSCLAVLFRSGVEAVFKFISLGCKRSELALTEVPKRSWIQMDRWMDKK